MVCHYNYTANYQPGMCTTALSVGHVNAEERLFHFRMAAKSVKKSKSRHKQNYYMIHSW